MKRILSAIAFMVACHQAMFAQCTTSGPIIIASYNNQPICEGQTFTLFICPGQYSSTGVRVPTPSWSFNPSPSSIVQIDMNSNNPGNPNYSSVQVSWNNGGAIYGTVSYTNSLGGGTVGLNFSVNAKPSIDLIRVKSVVPFFIIQGDICAGEAINFTGTNITNPGPSPTYTFYLDGNPIHQSTTSSTYNYLPDSISEGPHTAQMSIMSSGVCSAIAYSTINNFTVLHKSYYTVSLSRPHNRGTNFCASGSSLPAQFVAYTGDVFNPPFGGTPTYTWMVNGSVYSVSSVNTISMNITGLTDVQCIVSLAPVSGTPSICTNSPVASNHYIVAKTGTVTPSVQVHSNKSTYCTGESIILSTTGSQYLYGSPGYTWKLNGTVFSTSATPPALTAGTDPGPLVFTPGSTISLTVGGIDGVCLADPNNTSASGSLSLITINTTPIAATIPNSAICSGTQTSIPLSTSNYVPGTTTFNWTQVPHSASGGLNGSATVPTTLHQLLTSATGGSVTYTFTPSTVNCIGASVTTNVSVNPIPANPVASPVNRCGVGNVTLTGLPGTYGTEVHWYDLAAGGSLLGNTQSITQLISTNKTFYASSYNANTLCESQRVGVVATILDMYGAYVNSIITQEAMVDGLTTGTNMNTQPPENVSQKIQYFDGLGRPFQSVQLKYSPAKADLTSPTVYDQFGREYRTYLPFTSASDGCPKTDIFDASGLYTGAAQNFYGSPSSKIAVDSSPFTETTFEASPLSRVLKQGAAGVVWQPDTNPNSMTDHTVKHHYQFNSANEVIYFTYDPVSGLVGCVVGGQTQYYPANRLEANHTADEHQNDVVEFKDLEGHLICKKVQYKATSGTPLYACTYYIYDDLGNLAVVLPPEAVKAIVPQP